MSYDNVQTLKCPHCGGPIAIQVAPIQPTQLKPRIESVSLRSSVEAAIARWEESLTLSENDDSIAVSPNEFLGKDIWVRVNEALSPFGAEWISAGKTSRWNIAK